MGYYTTPWDMTKKPCYCSKYSPSERINSRAKGLSSPEKTAPNGHLRHDQAHPHMGQEVEPGRKAAIADACNRFIAEVLIPRFLPEALSTIENEPLVQPR